MTTNKPAPLKQVDALLTELRGLILCAEKSREQIELLQLDQDNIMVAEYWTVFPERPVFEKKIHNLLESAREQLARRKALLPGKTKGGEA